MRDKIIYEKIKETVMLLDEIDAMIETQSTQLQQVDLELSDWYHYIENNDISDAVSIKIMHEIKRLREYRRQLHNEYEIEATYKKNASKMMGNNTRGMLLAEIGKTIKQLDSEYKNRVLTEDKINEVIDTKKKRGRPKKVEEDE